MTKPKAVPAQKADLALSALALRQASGNSSHTATDIMILATKVSQLPMDCVSTCKTVSATKAPNGSVKPDKLASPKAKYGESGRAAKQGILIAIPSGILCKPMATAVVTPKC